MDTDVELGDVFNDGDQSEGDVFNDGDHSAGALAPGFRLSGAPRGPWARFPFNVGFGYHSDTPDIRDFTLQSTRKTLVKSHEKAIAKSPLFSKALPEKHPLKHDLLSRDELARWPANNQGLLHSCTAHTVIGLIELLLLKQRRQHVGFSRLFVYKAARRLLSWNGDSGATLRATFKAVKRFGIPSETFWPYDIAKFDVDPDAFLYAYADSFRSIMYTRLDEYGISGGQTLDKIRLALLEGFPVAFGFPIYNCVTQKAQIPYPKQSDQLIGCHSALAVGYQEEPSGKGHLLFRNSWGVSWGKNGYGWLPYEYVINQLAVDFWTVFHPRWLNREDALAKPDNHFD